MKIAILVGGCIRNSFSTFDSFVKNVVVPNNADVFMLFKPHTEYDCEHESNKMAFEAQARELLGDRLKYYAYTDRKYDQIFSMNSGQCKTNVRLHNPHIQQTVYHYDHLTEEINVNIVDQYTIMKFLADVLTKYEKTNSIVYDYVIKTRIDRMNFKDPLILGKVIFDYDGKNIEDLGHNVDISSSLMNSESNSETIIALNRVHDAVPNNNLECLYFGGHVGWYTDCFFFGTHDVMIELLKTFCSRLFSYHLTKNPDDEEYKETLAPEKQLIKHCQTLKHSDKHIKIITYCVPKIITADNPNDCDKCIKYNIYFNYPEESVP